MERLHSSKREDVTWTNLGWAKKDLRTRKKEVVGVGLLCMKTRKNDGVKMGHNI